MEGFMSHKIEILHAVSYMWSLTNSSIVRIVISGWEKLGDVSQTVLSLSHMVGLSTRNHVHMMTMGGAIVST